MILLGGGVGSGGRTVCGGPFNGSDEEDRDDSSESDEGDEIDSSLPCVVCSEL